MDDDIQQALQNGLPGFQQLVMGDRVGRAPVLLQVGGLRSARRPVYQRACGLDEVPPGGMVSREVEGHAILLARIDGQVYAVTNRCGDTPLPLQFGLLEGFELRCSWHGCRYDIRTGKRLDADAAGLAVMPVSVEDDEVRVAIAVEPVAGS